MYHIFFQLYVAEDGIHLIPKCIQFNILSSVFHHLSEYTAVSCAYCSSSHCSRNDSGVKTIYQKLNDVLGDETKKSTEKFFKTESCFCIQLTFCNLSALLEASHVSKKSNSDGDCCIGHRIYNTKKLYFPEHYTVQTLLKKLLYVTQKKYLN